jgi:hypothetical protein
VSLIGSLEQFDLANILRRIEIYSKTGLLVVKQGDLWVEFYFRQGQLVCIGPVRMNVTLIDRLLQANLLSPESLPHVRALISPHEINETRIALALINEGLLSREILRAWSSHETSQILQAIFSWPTGEVYFEDDRPTPADRLLIGLSVTALLEALPNATLAPQAASRQAPSTDELTHTPEYLARAVPYQPSAQLIDVGPGGQIRHTPASVAPVPGPLHAAPPFEQPPAFQPPNVPQPAGMLNASSLLDQPPTFTQSQTPMNGGGTLNASQLIDQPPTFAQQNPMNGSGMLNASQLIDQPPAFAQSVIV